MNESQIKTILTTEHSIPMDEWVTLQPFQSMAVRNDVNVMVNPFSTNFYFSTAGYVFIRRLNGVVEASTATEAANQKDGYVYFKEGDSYYREHISAFGIKAAADSGIGWFHDVLTYDTVVGFYSYETKPWVTEDPVKAHAIKLLTSPDPIVSTMGGITIYDDKQCIIGPVQVFDVDAEGFTKRLIPHGMVPSNSQGNLPLMLVSFRPGKGIASSSAYMSIDGTSVSDPLKDDSIDAVVSLSKAADHTIVISFDGITQYKYEISVIPKLLR